MHVYHIAWFAPSVNLTGDGTVRLDHSMNKQDLTNTKNNLRREFNLTDRVKIHITFIFELREDD